VAPPKRAGGGDDGSDSVIKDLKADTDYQQLRKGARRRKGVIWGSILMLLGGLGWAGWHYGHALFPTTAKPSPSVAPAPPKPEPQPTLAAPVPSAPPAVAELRKVALILFPLDAHAFDGKTDLGMMPILLEIKPGESKMIEVARKAYVTRTVRLDGTKSRVVIGLVSNAVAAKRKGLSQAEQEALADRAAEVQAETVVLDETEEPGAIPEVTETPPEKGAKPTEKGAKPAAAGKGKKASAPNEAANEVPPKP
jgi:hypothetical protein